MMNLQQKNIGNKGIALLLAMFTITIVAFLATELAYDTNIEYLVNSQSIQRIKAYYSARAGIDLSLLRIKLFQAANAQFGQQLGNQAKMLEMIWNTPFAWPPVLPTELNDVDKNLILDKVKESSMEASYLTVISDEGSKIDLNDLNSPSKMQRELTRKRLLQIFETKKRDDETWARAHSDLRPDDLVNLIADWVTPGRTSASGGDKPSKFSSIGENLPPNRAFRSVEEIHLIPGMTEEIFQLLKDQVTVYGMRAINPNHASKEVLMSLDSSMTSEVVDKIIQRRDDEGQGGSFRDAKEFWNFVTISGGKVDTNTQQNMPLIFNSVYNFVIKSTGNFKSSTREITAITFDLNQTAVQVSQQVGKENQTQQQQQSAAGAGGTNPNGQPGGTNQANSQQNKNTVSKGPPRIVYWNEK